MASIVTKFLYKTLLKRAQVFDAHPHLKVPRCLYRHQPTDPASQWRSHGIRPRHAKACVRMLLQLLISTQTCKLPSDMIKAIQLFLGDTHRRYYLPGGNAEHSRSLVNTVRRTFRDADPDRELTDMTALAALRYLDTLLRIAEQEGFSGQPLLPHAWHSSAASLTSLSLCTNEEMQHQEQPQQLSFSTDAQLLGSASNVDHVQSGGTAGPAWEASQVLQLPFSTPNLPAGGSWPQQHSGIVFEHRRDASVAGGSSADASPSWHAGGAPPLCVERVSAPEVGMVLLPHPLLTDRRTARSVVLLCQHSDEEGGGTVGLLLNRKSSHSVKRLLGNQELRRPFEEVFGLLHDMEGIVDSSGQGRRDKMMQVRWNAMENSNIEVPLDGHVDGQHMFAVTVHAHEQSVMDELEGEEDKGDPVKVMVYVPLGDFEANELDSDEESDVEDMQDWLMFAEGSSDSDAGDSAGGEDDDDDEDLHDGQQHRTLSFSKQRPSRAALAAAPSPAILSHVQDRKAVDASGGAVDAKVMWPNYAKPVPSVMVGAEHGTQGPSPQRLRDLRRSGALLSWAHWRAASSDPGSDEHKQCDAQGRYRKAVTQELRKQRMLRRRQATGRSNMKAAQRTVGATAALSTSDNGCSDWHGRPGRPEPQRRYSQQLQQQQLLYGSAPGRGSQPITPLTSQGSLPIRQVTVQMSGRPTAPPPSPCSSQQQAAPPFAGPVSNTSTGQGVGLQQPEQHRCGSSSMAPQWPSHADQLAAAAVQPVANVQTTVPDGNGANIWKDPSKLSTETSTASTTSTVQSPSGADSQGPQGPLSRGNPEERDGPSGELLAAAGQLALDLEGPHEWHGSPSRAWNRTRAWKGVAQRVQDIQQDSQCSLREAYSQAEAELRGQFEGAMMVNRLVQSSSVPLWLGGNRRLLTVLHSIPDIAGQPVIAANPDTGAPAVYTLGKAKDIRLLTAMAAEQPQGEPFRVVCGAMRWYRSQLQREIEQGMWIVVRADANALELLGEALQQEPTLAAPQQNSDCTQAAVADRLWAKLLCALGSEYAHLAAVPKTMPAALRKLDISSRIRM